MLRFMTAMSLGLVCLGAYAQEPAVVDTPTKLYDMANLPTQLENAKKSVFPALVFIQVIQENNDYGRTQKVTGSGSGVLITADGEILTNWHVVNKAESIRCQLSDGSAHEATLIGLDKDLDIALIKLKGDVKNLPTAELNPKLTAREGEFVLAMGAPWGMSRSVSLGIVSCAKRYLPQSDYALWIQTDASISPGNSGGPLVNTNGKVIGINTLGNLRGGDMGFAVPSNVILEVINNIRDDGVVNWSWTGISLQVLNDFTKNIYFERGNGGIIVSHIEPKSPGKDAGLQPEDRILEINGVRCDGITEEDLPDIKRRLYLLPADKEAVLKVERKKQLMEIKIKPVERGSSEGRHQKFDRFGIIAKEINRFETPTLFHHREKGIFIEAFTERSNAEKSEFSTQDIIVDIDGKEIKSLKDLTEVYDALMEKLPAKNKVTIRIQRGTQQLQKVLDYTNELTDEDDELF